MAMREDAFPAVIELNVGGVFYTTHHATLVRDPNSLLARIFGGGPSTGPHRDSRGKFFVDRDGVLFRYVLDYLRDPPAFLLPEHFGERRRLRSEALHFELPGLVAALDAAGPPRTPGYIVLGYRGTFAGMADVKFRKLSRILVSGRVQLCREVFGETLNESRDPDRGTEARYSARFFLKHNFLEQAFDRLQEAGFRCLAAAGSGTAPAAGEPLKPGMDCEESRWNHYNEFVFSRP